MGKGDQRSKKGKRVRKTWGVSRPRTDKGRGAFTTKVYQAPVEVEEEKKKKAPAKKKAVKKAAPKAAPAVEETKAAAPAAEPKVKKAAPKKAAKKTGGDDLTKIEGIGPKIASTLTEGGVATFADLAKADTAKLAEIIKDVRGNHVPDTWPQQAGLAADGKWDELKVLQDELDGGKKK